MIVSEFTDVPALLGELQEKYTLDEVAAKTNIERVRLAAIARREATASVSDEWLLYGFCDRFEEYDALGRYGVAPPVYPRQKSFSFEAKPLGADLPVPQRRLKNRPSKIAGLRVDFPLGIPASILTPTHEWLTFFARRGFDILTYKTVRSDRNLQWGREDVNKGHQFPNWAFVTRLPQELEFPFESQVAIAKMDHWPPHPGYVAMVNSFGVPSQPVRAWHEDVGKARRALGRGQVLVVSIMGSPESCDTEGELVSDFGVVARQAVEAGAQIIEVNLSCPNTKGGIEDVYTKPALAAAVCQEVRSKVGATPVLAKIGYLPITPLAEFLKATSEYIQGVVAINTIKMRVQRQDGADFFPGRTLAGISGSPIRRFALETVRNLVSLREQQRYELTILAVGGVTSPEHVDEFLALGADAVESCTGSLLNPYLGIETRLEGRVTRDDLKKALGAEGLAALDSIRVQG